MLVDMGVAYQKIVDIVQAFSLVSGMQLFDLYEGKQVPEGKKSLAFRLTYQSADHTLKDEEVDKLQQRILERLSKDLGATFAVMIKMQNHFLHRFLYPKAWLSFMPPRINSSNYHLVRTWSTLATKAKSTRQSQPGRSPLHKTLKPSLI
jgi:hypothetical protein